MYLIALIFLFAFLLTSLETAKHNFISPCPDIFQYETDSIEPDRWYGRMKLVSHYDTHGVFFHVILDRPAVQLGNWYGVVFTANNQHFIIGNTKEKLKANVPVTVRFYIQYNTAEPIPQFIGTHLNSKQICPKENFTDEAITDGTTTSLEPTTSAKPPINVDDICGTIVDPPKSLITNGQQPNTGEFPWHVSIYYAKGIEWTYICGASLISKDFIITVAHCVTLPRSSTPLDADSLSVYLGKQYLQSFSNEGIQSGQISEIIIHPQYTGKAIQYTDTVSNDIALLKLSLPAEFTNFVRPICLWQDSPLLNAIDNKYGNIVRWGLDEDGKMTDELAQTELLVVSQETCLATYPLYYVRISDENSYCAGFKNGTSVCNADIGGGMVFPKSNSSLENQVWQLRGLVSISAATQTEFNCDPSNYVIFTDTIQYLDWIKNNIK